MYFCAKYFFTLSLLFQSIYCQICILPSSGSGTDPPDPFPEFVPPLSTTSIDQDTEKQLSHSTTTPTTVLIEDFNDDHRIVCYFTNWARYRSEGGKFLPNDTDTKLCTHINYAFGTLDPDSLTITFSDLSSDVINHGVEEVIALKKQNPKLKVLLSLGGWLDAATDKYSRLIKKMSSRRNFITTSIKFLKKYQFDGLDVDWVPKCYQGSCERGSDQDKDNFSTFIGELRKAFVPLGLLLTAAVSPLKNIIDAAYDVRSIAKDFDYISVVTYDIPRQWDKFATHHAPLHPRRESSRYDINFSTFTIYYAINHWLKKGMPKKKINLGVPFFGRSYTLEIQADDHPFKGYGAITSKAGDAGPFTKEAGALAYYEICDFIKTQNWTKARDPSTRYPFAYKGDQWVSYDDTEQMKKKSTYIKTLGLGGAMVWTLDFDDFSGRCCPTKWPLLKTLNAELRGVKSYEDIDC